MAGTMIPTYRTLYLLGFGALLSIFPLWWGYQGMIPWIGYMAAVAMLLSVSHLHVRRFNATVVSLKMPDTLYINAEDSVSITVSSPLRFPVKARLRVESEGEARWESTSSLNRLEVGENFCTYRLKPLRRGVLKLSSVVVRIEDYLGIWEIEKKFNFNKTCRVLPNLREVGRYSIKFLEDPHARMGIKVQKYRGEGSEFESLREYLPGFDIRTLDWKASARKAKLVCREFQAEKNHEVILALDCGYLMGSEFEGVTKLDHAINALLVLGYVAVKTGDRVGFVSFDNQILGYLRPQAQPDIVQQISNQCSGVSYGFKATNFVVPIEYLMAQQKRRALIIMFTDFTDSISAEVMKDYLSLLSMRHLVLFVSVRDPFLDSYVHERPEGLLDLHKKVACYNLKEEREIVFQELRRMGLHCMDLTPSNICVPVINRYIEIRRRELI